MPRSDNSTNHCKKERGFHIYGGISWIDCGHQPPSCVLQSIELTEKALDFLKGVFSAFDLDGVSM